MLLLFTVCSLLSLAPLSQGIDTKTEEAIERYIQTKDDAIDAYIRAILENLVGQMTTGIPELGIPVLDPLAVPHFDIPHISEDIVEMDVRLDNLVGTGLSTMDFPLVHLELEALELSLSLHIPVLRADGEYFLDGLILSIFPIYGEGPMWIEVYDLTLSAKAGVVVNEEGFIQVYELELDGDISDIKLHLDGLLGEGSLGETINNIVNLLGKKIWDLVKGSLFDLLNRLLIGVINDALAGCNLADLIDTGSCYLAVVAK